MVEIGSAIRARVARIEPYGVWLDYQGEKVLVLITEFSRKPVRDLKKAVQIGTELDVLVIRHNTKDQVLVGSVRSLEPEPDVQVDVVDQPARAS